MKINRLFLIIFSGITGIVVCIVVLINLMLINQNSLRQSETRRFESYQRADELRQSSDDLTRLARSYVSTGDDRFEKMYWDVLAIRNGELPRPQNYEKIYWDYVAFDGRKPRPDGEKIPLRQLFKEVGFSEEEMAKVTESQRNSDSLVRIETVAMNAMKGLFDDGTGRFTRTGAPDRTLARDLMFSQAYHKEKVRIMQPIDEFFTLQDQRTLHDVQKYRSRSTLYFIFLLLLSTILGIAALAGYLLIRQRVVKKLGGDPADIEEISRKVAKGELDVSMPAKGQPESGVMESINQMVGSLHRMARVAHAISQGDLTLEVTPASEQDVMGNAFRLMVTRLRDQLDEIRKAVSILSSSSNEILATMSQLAATAGETATSIGETTVTVEEVKQTAEVSNQKAKNVSENAVRTAEISSEGIKAIANTIEGMNRIRQQMNAIAGMVVKLSEQSQTIGEIMTSVNELAEQSNLLAVNAAIEAAKAGEQGKGFTIVAQEIKVLANRSKDATAQVRTILREIQKSISSAVMATEEGGKAVEEGLHLTNLSGETIQALSASVNEAAQAAIQIAASSQQQLEGMDQVVTAMENIREASMQAATSTQQSVDSVHNLQKAGQKLDDLMKQYRLVT